MKKAAQITRSLMAAAGLPSQGMSQPDMTEMQNTTPILSCVHGMDSLYRNPHHKIVRPTNMQQMNGSTKKNNHALALGTLFLFVQLSIVFLLDPTHPFFLFLMMTMHCVLVSPYTSIVGRNGIAVCNIDRRPSY